MDPNFEDAFNNLLAQLVEQIKAGMSVGEARGITTDILLVLEMKERYSDRAHAASEGGDTSSR